MLKRFGIRRTIEFSLSICFYIFANLSLFVLGYYFEAKITVRLCAIKKEMSLFTVSISDSARQYCIVELRTNETGNRFETV